MSTTELTAYTVEQPSADFADAGVIAKRINTLLQENPGRRVRVLFEVIR